ncbi:MAG TPA: imidazole glycerol phosphate synthase subunit HisH [Coxiellaceae bacterium]|nr:imidazole glycerol phosphate synthase subunit HisH [Coxiellaceae bacterium]
MKTAHIIDYGMGNFFSLTQALQHIGVTVTVCHQPKQLENAHCIVLPGVGAFGDSMHALAQRGFIPAILSHVNNQKMLMGICLGMHLLANEGHEFGSHKGLGLIPGRVQHLRHFNSISLKIPHMAWQMLYQDSQGHSERVNDSSYYFMHSYAFACENQQDEVAYCWYNGLRITAMVRKQNIYGLQFHPEKSGKSGLRLLNALMTEGNYAL